MARKRLTPAQSGYLEPKSAITPLPRAPIADVAGEAAAASAFHDLAAELASARSEGRMVVTLPLEAVRADHLIRDRLMLDDDDMAALMASLRARGQQTPIEVVDLGDGAYGLISGKRRLTALQALVAQTGETRFTKVQALVRSPESDAAAYTAMVEENEIRVGLSFFERARVVRRAVTAGVFADEQAALQGLFAAASYSKRSKIKSFLGVVDALGEVLRHPARLSEHLGLKLARALAEDPALAGDIARDVIKLAPGDAEAEQAVLQRHLSHAKGEAAAKPAASSKQAQTEPDTAEKPEKAEIYFRQIIKGLTLTHDGKSITLNGPRATDAFRKQLERWLKSVD